MEDQFTKKLPFSLIAEQSLLGAILVDPESLNDVAEIVTSSDFYLTVRIGIQCPGNHGNIHFHFPGNIRQTYHKTPIFVFRGNITPATAVVKWSW